MNGAFRQATHRDVHYPDSDGKPMAERDLHRNEMVDLIERLKVRYEDRPDVYVAGNLLVYYEKGEVGSCFAPDCLVVFGVEKKLRRSFMIWKEVAVPRIVFEVTSRDTWQEDRGTKRGICESLGVLEYILYDPEAEYLDPPLQLFRLRDGTYVRIAAGRDGTLASHVLGLRMSLDDRGLLELADARSGERLLRPAEERAARRTAEDARRTAEDARRTAEDARSAAEGAAAEERAARLRLEAEVARLRARIEGHRRRRS